eukprot:TRINITY_DN75174_c0_g1_i1.p1 TRINITY_DN75174_c0_g1~~TRINITY_DN75174_c0_g1_i1.p1  ORF type:complete len:379 (+),score=50.26 TRINITY_DN75174_c0_g1_i1:85-1137(+)
MLAFFVLAGVLLIEGHKGVDKEDPLAQAQCDVGDASCTEVNVSLLQLEVERNSATVAATRGARAVLSPATAVAEPSNAIASSCGVVWFYHVPKCGGSTYKQYLDAQQGTLINFMSHYDKRLYWSNPGPNGLQAQLQSIDDAMQRMRPGRGYVSVHHHHAAPGLEFMLSNISQYREQVRAKGCTFILATILRKPMDRMISSFFYDFHGDTHDAEDFRFNMEKRVLASEKFDNRELRYLINGWGCEDPDSPERRTCPPHDVDLPRRGLLDGKVLKRGLKLLDAFDIIGITSGMAQFIKAVDHRMGWQAQQTENSKVNSIRDDDLLSSEDREVFKANSRLDEVLYKRAVQLAV